MRIRTLVSVVLLAAVLLAACNPAAETEDLADTGDTAAGDAASPTPAEEGDAQTPDPATDAEPPADLGDVTISVGARVLSFAPYFVAEEQGWLEEAGLEVETFDTGGGAVSVQALLSGDVLLGGSGSPEAINAALTTGNSRVVATVATNLGSEIIVSKEVAEQGNLSRDMPLEERVAALEGLRIGVTSSGSTTDQLIRFMLETHGLDPDADASIVALGDAQSIIGALRGGSVDAVVLSPPTGQIIEGDDIGTVLISPPRGDVPGLTGMIFITFSARTADMEDENARAQMVAAIKAIARFQRLLQEDPAEAQRLVRESFAELDEDVFEAAWEVVSAGIPPDPIPTEESIQIAIDFQEATSDETIEWSYEDVADPSLAEEALAELDQD